jgi:hypothetical protein
VRKDYRAKIIFLESPNSETQGVDQRKNESRENPLESRSASTIFWGESYSIKDQDVKICREPTAPKRLEWPQMMFSICLERFHLKIGAIYFFSGFC